MKTLTAAQVVPLMERSDARGCLVPLTQLVMGWNRATDRASLIAQEPTGDQRLVVKVAVVVRALADRDGVAVPAWVDGCVADKDLTLSDVDIDSDYGRLIRDCSPQASAVHRVYFDAELLSR